MRTRSSVKCTALIGVTPGTSGSSVKGACTLTANVCVADVFEPSTSVAVTVTVDVPADNGATVTTLPDADTEATRGADEVAV